VYHGLPLELLGQASKPAYPRFSWAASPPEKEVDRAIEIARRTRIPLKIAAKVDRVDRDFFISRIEPLIDGTLIEYIGEIGERREKTAFLGEAFGAAVSHRLAGAFWPDDDRGNGLRHPGDCISPWIVRK